MNNSVCAFLGVLAVSWYPPGMKDENGEPTDDIVPLILEAAHAYHVKVCMIINEKSKHGSYTMGFEVFGTFKKMSNND